MTHSTTRTTGGASLYALDELLLTLAGTDAPGQTGHEQESS